MSKISNPYDKSALMLYAITILFYTITYMMMVILPLYMSKMGASTEKIGLVMGVTAFATMIFRPFAGKLVDKIGARKILIFTLLLFPLSILGFFISSIPIYGLSRLLMGIAAAFFSTALGILTIQLFSDHIRGKGLSLYSLASMLPSTFGPALALYLINLVSIETLFLIFLILGIINIFIAKYLPIEIIEKKEYPQTKDGDFLTLYNRVFISSSLAIFFISITNGAIFTFLPLYFNQIHLEHVSLYFLVQTTVLVIARFICGRFIDDNRENVGRIVFILAILSATGTLIISLSHNFYWFILAAILNGIAFSSLYPILATLVSFAVSKKSLGFLMSLFIGCADFGVALGAGITGIIVAYSSYSTMYLFCSVMALLGGIIFYLINNHHYLGKKALASGTLLPQVGEEIK